jgi:hypothetical protein
MYNKKSSGYEFRCDETNAIKRELLFNNIAVIFVVVSMAVVVGKWFSIADARMMMQQVSEFYLIGYCLTFGCLFLLLIGVISIRPNDKLKRFLVRGIWDKLLY